MKTLSPEKMRLHGLNRRFLLLAGSWALLFFPTFTRLADYGWRSADYDHGWYVVPVFLFLLWHRRELLAPAAGLSRLGLLLFSSGIAAYLFGAVNRFMFLEASAIFLVTAGLMRLELDARSWRILRFPLLYLLLVIPPPAMVLDAVTMPLKKVSMLGAYGLLRLLHIPVESYGVVLQIGTHQMFIADACSGFRSIITMTALSSVYLFFQPFSSRAKAWLLAAVVPISILSNVLRLTLTGFISWHYGHERAEGFFHSFSGAVLFVIAAVLFLCLMEAAHAFARKKS